MVIATAATADTLRIATYHTELSRDGPGLLLRDITGEDDQSRAVAKVIATAAPDILLLTGFDYDAGRLALTALRDRIAAEGGPAYPHLFALPPNRGVPSGLDLNRDGLLGGPDDALGYGEFAGQAGMALLSMYPVEATGVMDLSGLLWRDLPGATLPVLPDGTSFYADNALELLPLSTTGHWMVPVDTPNGLVTLMAFYATTPVFDGPEDRNGLRNRDELRLWQLVLDGSLAAAPSGPFVILGNANLDPVDGAGYPEAMRSLLSDLRLQDPAPSSAGGAAAADPTQSGPSGQDTADWPEPDPGNLRVDYVLPSANLHVVESGVFWPDPGDPLADTVTTASRHRLVWVDLEN